MLDQALAQIVKWIKKLSLLKYSIFCQLGALLFSLLLVYPYYENQLMDVVKDTGWVRSPNGYYQARLIMKRRFSSHLIVQFILRSNIGASDWYEIMNGKLINQVTFKNWPPDLTGVSWVNGTTLNILYYSERGRPFTAFDEYRDLRVYLLRIP